MKGFLTSLLLLWCATAAASPATHPATAPAELRHVLDSTETSFNALLKTPDSADQLAECVIDSSMKFWSAVGASERPEQLIHDYATAFGQGDWKQDLKLVLLAPELAIPQGRGPWKSVIDDPADVARGQILRLAANEVARVQVSRCLKDPRYLDRLYRTSLWAGSLGGDHPKSAIQFLIACANQGAKETDKSTVWWHIRNFVIVCHALGVDPLAKDVTVENFPQKLAFLIDIYDTFFSIGMIPAKGGLTWCPAFKRGVVTPVDIPTQPFEEGPKLRKLLMCEFSHFHTENSEIREAVAKAGLKHQVRMKMLD